MKKDNIADITINTLRFLAADAVQQANAGHPGLPLGAAPMAYVLWKKFLKHNPANTAWYDRDRFVLSAGHGSALLYALLHLAGYDLSLDQLRNFRQWGSKTPGHPEFGHTPGVETTTGPLGQGFANGVGMAMAECYLANKFNKSGFNIVDHNTYAIVSDGDLMEGISSEAASLAGHLGLGKLIYLYDDNSITIDGSTDLAFTEDVEKRFSAYNWQVIRVIDGNDVHEIEGAIVQAREVINKPSLIMIKTEIGYGSPKQGTSSAHGEPLGEESLLATKDTLNWPSKEKFHVPEEARANFDARKQGENSEKNWNNIFNEYSEEHPELASNFQQIINGEMPADWESSLPYFSVNDGPVATRVSSGNVLNALSEVVDNLVGGSADLEPSNKTFQKSKPIFKSAKNPGQNIHFGVREHAMGGIANGLALHGGIIPYVATFLIFSDYMKASIRLAALMQTRVIYIFTHDSLGVGEDGPTHQPIEQLMSLRLIPGLTVIRPADANETSEAWRIALSKDGPVAIILTRQNLPVMHNIDQIIEGVPRGAYIVSGDDNPQIILLATGSEVSLAEKARQSLFQENIKSRVVSMPSRELFSSQSEEYRNTVLTPGIPVVTVEAGVSLGWHSYLSSGGKVIGIDQFGASASGEFLMEKFGLEVKNVVRIVKEILK
ncbi:MAG: transketolase [SAR202 cluster bacterium]|nr:transketolase [SAR202 cluster bacterium]|tara:strand:- start:6655 stop:8640 length:1986 start_codon:yes stop_codon:yes gene_type:complete